MATTKTTSAAPAKAADETPDTVQLHSEALGKTQDFSAAHAKALLKFQQSRGLKPEDCWLPVAAAAAADSSNT